MVWRFTAVYQVAWCAAFALCLTACHGNGPVLVDQKRVPGTYLMNGSEFTDELVLKEDGTMIRTATLTGERWTQIGRWTSRQLRTSRSSANTVVEFTYLQPECAIGRGPGSKPFPWPFQKPRCARVRRLPSFATITNGSRSASMKA